MVAKFVEDALLLRFVTRRRLLIAVVFWMTLCNPFWPALIAVVAIIISRIIELSQDASFSPEPPSPIAFLILTHQRAP